MFAALACLPPIEARPMYTTYDAAISYARRRYCSMVAAGVTQRFHPDVLLDDAVGRAMNLYGYSIGADPYQLRSVVAVQINTKGCRE